MSWIGGSISSLTGQLSNLTKDILTEGTEEISDPATELRLAKERIVQLDAICTSQRQENERLKNLNRELEERAESSELQINTISREYRAVLESKEREVNALKQQHQDLLEVHASTANLTSPSEHSATHRPSHPGQDSWASDGFDFSGDSGGWDFDDSIRLQRENNKLRSELQQLQAQAKHWRSVAGQLGQSNAGDDKQQTAGPDVLELQQRIKTLEHELSVKGEELRQQAASLHDHQRQKMATLKSRHQQEIQTLQDQVASLEAQLTDVGDSGSSSRHSGSGILPESDRQQQDSEKQELQRQLAQALHDKEKSQNALSHLEGMLEELQQEVVRLQQQQEEQHKDDSDGSASVSLLQQVADLSQKLQVSEQTRRDLETELKEADAQEVLSELRELKESMDMEAVTRRGNLQVEMRTLVNQLFRVGQKKSELQESLQKTKSEQEEVLEKAQNLVEGLGDPQHQRLTAELFNSLEKENLVLKEEKLKLEEQVTLLEKSAVTSATEKQKLQQKVSALKAKLQITGGEDPETSDDTLDTDFTSNHSEPPSALHFGQDEIERELASLRAQLAKQKDHLSEVEMDQDDWQMEREALEDVVTDLRKLTQQQEEEIKSLKSGQTGPSQGAGSTQALEAEISSLKADKQELESALEELDSQQSQALEQLIAHRNKLQADLDQCQADLLDKDQTISQLEFTVSQLQASLKEQNQTQQSAPFNSELEEWKEKYALLQKELAEVKSNQSNGGLDVKHSQREIAELKEKLQKGGLVINDLHMDKQELQEEVKRCKEEIAVKVDKIKSMREENMSLREEKKAAEERLMEMEDRLSEMEGEVEKWQSLNEKQQISQMEANKNENDTLKSRVLELEQQIQSFNVTQVAESLEKVSSMSEMAIEHVSLGEAKVLQSLQEDHKLIHELKQQVQKLYEDKKKLKESLREREQSEKAVSEKLTEVESELSTLQVQLHTLEKEKSDMKSELESKLTEAGGQHQELMVELASREQQLSYMAGQMEGQKEHFDQHLAELQAAQSLGEDSLKAEHQKLLSAQLEKDQMIEELNCKINTQTQELTEKEEKIKQLQSTIEVFQAEMATVKNEITRLENVCDDKDKQIESLKSRMSQFDNDLEDIESSVTEAEEKHKLELSGKESQLAELKDRNSNLERSLSQVQMDLERLSSQVDGPSADRKQPKDEADTSVSDSVRVAQLLNEVEALTKERDSLQETVSRLQIDLSLSTESLTKVNEDLSTAQHTIQCHEAGITHLNEKTDQQRKELEKASTDLDQQKSTMAVLRQSSVDKDIMMKEIQKQLSFLLTILTPRQMEQLKSYSVTSELPAISYIDHMAIEFSKFEDGSNENQDRNEEIPQSNVTISEVNDYIVEDYDEVERTELENNRFAVLEKELEDVVQRLKEKDQVVLELQKSNSSLLNLLENKGTGDKTISFNKSNPVLEAEIQSLKVEKEQMLAVISEKSRENSMQKAEVHRLMEVVAAGQAALEKLQSDNQSEHKQRSPHRDEEGEDDMRREALANMARLVRDRETEIEALKQKNETLLSVLQESGETQAAAHLGPVLREKEELSQQLQAMSSEREQLIACVTQKHSEALAYHAETQRLAALLADVQESRLKVQAEYDTLVPSYEDKSRALVAAQTELIGLRQKLTDLEVRHGELIQRSNSEDAPSSPKMSSMEVELKHLRLTESDLRSALAQRDEKVQSLTHKLNTVEDSLSSKESECAHLKKHADNSKFQLTSLMSEIAELRQEREQRQQKSSEQDSETASLRDSINKLTLQGKEKEMEVLALKEQVVSLTSLLQQQQGDKGQVTQLVKEKEVAMATTRQLQQERDQQAMLAQQRGQELAALRTEIANLKDKEFKMSRELERLRGHLIEIEEGYTQEALASEEREKDLRNRLASAEEQLMSSSSQVELASRESHRQIEALQQQLQHVASQRDSAYMQVASIQEQCQQYATSLGNLQLVLEHFQKEKDSAVASETERYQDECNRLKDKVAELNNELQATRGDLADALDGLEAASRISEQLDKKEEALRALKEEVQLRENALKEAEDEIKKLTSNTEAKVDKTLMHNMVMTWLTSPESKRPEIVHLIGNILSFSPDDFQKIEAAQGHGGLFSIFRRQAQGGAQTPGRPAAGNQSFSQLFVKFLEKESSPPPSPVRLPAEAMATEAQHRHKPPPGFNPFTAPRHVTHDASHGERMASTHLLMSHDSPQPTPLFAPLTSTTRAGESAILKDVLGKS